MENATEKKKVNKKVLWKTILCVFCTFIVYKAGSQCLILMQLDNIITLFIREAWMLLCALGGAAVVKKLDALKLTGKKFGTGIVVGLWFLIFPAISFVLQLIQGFPVTIPAWGVVLFVIAMLFIGVGEELLFRGVLLGGCLDAFGEDSAGAIRKAVVVSGIAFGLVHVFNFLAGAPLGSTLIQGIANIPSGILFGAIYVRSEKNLWPGVVLHAWNDFCSFTAYGMLIGYSATEAFSHLSILNLFVSLVVLALAMFVLRTKKLQPLVKAPSTEEV